MPETKNIDVVLVNPGSRQALLPHGLTRAANPSMQGMTRIEPRRKILGD